MPSKDRLSSANRAVAIDGLTFAYPSRGDLAPKLFEDFKLYIDRQEWIALVGPSGCGKSTLAKLITGIEIPNRGTIAIFGQSPHVARAARQIGVAFQGHNLVPWFSARRNIQLPLVGSENERSAGATLLELAKAFRIQKKLDSLPAELSGGMLARVSLARALIHRPSLVVLDEPFASLDEITAIGITRYLLGWRKENPCTLILISHDLEAVARLTDRCLCFPASSKGTFSMIDFGAYGPPSVRSPATVARIRLRLLEKYI